MKILRFSAYLRHVLLLALGAAFVATGLAQQGGGVRIIDGGNFPSTPFGTRPTVTPLTRLQQKMGRSIRRKVKQLEEAGITSLAAKGVFDPGTFSTALLRVDDAARIHSYIHVTSLEQEQITALESIPGLIVESQNTDMSVVQAWIPVDQVESVADLSFVEKVTAPSYGRAQAGSVQSEGDAILNADDVRVLGTDGTGVKVGIISDGFNGLATAVGTGDLPGGVTTFGTSLGGEGVSMAEIIYDLAPGATLAICQGLTTVTFVNCVTSLKDTFGADVIVDDIVFFGEPMFEDGVAATAYQAAMDAGVTVVSIAGNYAGVHHQASFNKSADGTGRHQFTPGDATFSFRLKRPPGGVPQDWVDPLQAEVLIFMQWSNPFGQSDDDFAFCLVDSATTPSFRICDNVVQDGDDDPFEVLLVQWAIAPFTQTSTLFVEAGRFNDAAVEAEVLEIFIVPSNLGTAILESLDPGSKPEDSLFGHAALPGVISTGAINADEPGNDLIADYSSLGPSTICLFNGSECEAVAGSTKRATPAITGIDKVSVTTAGLGFSPFVGTSAAAPHIAAIAALLLEDDPSLTPAGVLTALQNTAADRGVAGFDNTYGAGLANAEDALDNTSPDLTLTALTATAAVASGSTTTSTTVENIALAGSSFVPFDVSYYFSTDAFLDAGDIRSSTTCTVPGLGPGLADNTTCANIAVAVPFSLGPGDYTLFAKVDGLEVVAESNESNNTIEADTGIIGVGCPATFVTGSQHLTGVQTLQATTSATLGEALLIDGTDIIVKAPTVSILANTRIGGTFSISTTPSCP